MYLVQHLAYILNTRACETIGGRLKELWLVCAGPVCCVTLIGVPGSNPARNRVVFSRLDRGCLRLSGCAFFVLLFVLPTLEPAGDGFPRTAILDSLFNGVPGRRGDAVWFTHSRRPNTIGSCSSRGWCSGEPASVTVTSSTSTWFLRQLQRRYAFGGRLGKLKEPSGKG